MTASSAVQTALEAFKSPISIKFWLSAPAAHEYTPIWPSMNGLVPVNGSQKTPVASSSLHAQLPVLVTDSGAGKGLVSLMSNPALLAGFSGQKTLPLAAVKHGSWIEFPTMQRQASVR